MVKQRIEYIYIYIWDNKSSSNRHKIIYICLIAIYRLRLKRIKVKVDGPFQNKTAIGDGAELMDDKKQDNKLRYWTKRPHDGWSPIMDGWFSMMDGF